MKPVPTLPLPHGELAGDTLANWTPGTEIPRLTGPGRPTADQTYNRSSRVGPGTQRWHPSPLVSEPRNPYRGWIRFRGPVNLNRREQAAERGDNRLGGGDTVAIGDRHMWRSLGRQPSRRQLNSSRIERRRPGGRRRETLDAWAAGAEQVGPDGGSGWPPRLRAPCGLTISGGEKCPWSAV